MDVTIGMHNVSREVSIQTESTPEDVKAALAAALADENGTGMLELVDTAKGRTLLVPANSIAYVELGDDAHPRVGFGAAY